MQLFVYGSLLRGMSLSSYMEGAKFLGPAYVKADLFYLGFYPGIIPGEQVVFGELYEVGDEHLPVIDEVEDYIELDNERSAYLRRPIDAYRFSDGKKVNAQAYYYNRCPEGKPRIECGDYRTFMTTRENSSTWVIGYATNLSSKKVYDKLGTIPEYRKGVVEGFERVYNLKTGINGNAYANLEFTGSTKSCQAVIWKLNENQIRKLDEFEDVPNNYFRVSVPFRTFDGEFIHAQTYFANTEKLATNLYPDPQCHSLVLMGMREHGFIS